MGAEWSVGGFRYGPKAEWLVCLRIPAWSTLSSPLFASRHLSPPPHSEKAYLLPSALSPRSQFGCWAHRSERCEARVLAAAHPCLIVLLRCSSEP